MHPSSLPPFYDHDSGRYEFSRPAEHVKALNVPVGSIPQKIFDDMTKYNDTSRGMYFLSSRAPYKLELSPWRFLHPRFRVRWEECQTQYRRLPQAKGRAGFPALPYPLRCQLYRARAFDLFQY
jgi:hypothetical protein